MEKIDSLITDILLDCPIEFEAGGRRFSMRHPTFGQVLLVQKILDSSGFDRKKFAENPIVESIRMCKANQGAVLKAVAVMLMNGKEASESRKVDRYVNEIKEVIDCVNDLPTLLVMIATRDNQEVDSVIRGTQIHRDRENMQRINAVKKSKNSYLFGRRTVYGQIFDTVCSRYGWTIDYVLWGISYVNLELMMADQEVSVYLSDKEVKDVHVSNDRDVINADDPANAERIRQLFND